MILYNDRLVQRQDVHVDIEDRGYQFGDGIYEVCSVYQEKIFRLEDHLERFAYCAQQLQLSLPLSMDQLRENLLRLIEVNQLSDGQVYFQLTRGYAPRGHAFPNQAQAVLTGYITTKPRPLREMREGVKAITTDDIRWLRCDIKSLNLLGSVLAKQKAVEQEAYEAILHRQGIVTEGSSSNLFMVKHNQLYTHPLDNLILGGITRKVVLELATRLGLAVHEVTFSLDELLAADEVFITSTTSEVMPIVTLDNQTLSGGEPGKVTLALQKEFHQLIGV